MAGSSPMESLPPSSTPIHLGGETEKKDTPPPLPRASTSPSSTLFPKSKIEVRKSTGSEIRPSSFVRTKAMSAPIRLRSSSVISKTASGKVPAQSRRATFAAIKRHNSTNLQKPELKGVDALADTFLNDVASEQKADHKRLTNAIDILRDLNVHSGSIQDKSMKTKYNILVQRTIRSLVLAYQSAPNEQAKSEIWSELSKLGQDPNEILIKKRAETPSTQREQEMVKTEETYIKGLDTQVAVASEALKHLEKNPGALKKANQALRKARAAQQKAEPQKKLGPHKDITIADIKKFQSLTNAISHFGLKSVTPPLTHQKMHEFFDNPQKMNTYTMLTANYKNNFDFMLNVGTALKTMQEQREKANPNVNIRPESQGALQVTDFVIMPIQRFPRYELLLKDQISEAQKNGQTQKATYLQGLLGKIQKAGAEINQA